MPQPAASTSTAPIPATPIPAKASGRSKPPILSPAVLAIVDRMVLALTVVTATAVVVGTHQWDSPSSRELLPVMIERPAR